MDITPSDALPGETPAEYFARKGNRTRPERSDSRTAPEKKTIEQKPDDVDHIFAKVKDIIVGPRHRKDLGDIATLAKSIQQIGLLQPLVCAAGFRLIAGRRRLEAVRKLGWEKVSVIIVNSLDDTLKALVAERDENTCRKEFAPSEAVTIGKAIEELEKPKAKERQKATQAKGKDKHGKPVIGGGNFPPPKEDNGKTRDKVAEVVGMSGRTYEKAKRVVEAAEKEPEKHVETVKEMDRTGKVDGAYKKVKERPSRTAEKHYVADEELDALAADADALLERLEKMTGLKARAGRWDSQRRWQFCDTLEAVSRHLRRHAGELRHYTVGT